MATPSSPDFPCQLTLTIPLPTPTHATTAHRVLTIDAELSPLVHRHLSISPAARNVLVVRYAATTNRMLRVAVNGFFDSLAVVLGVMHECDEDIVLAPGGESVEGAQGVVGVEG
ncbi:transcription factor Pcc1-domain-containing protein [Phyllosticta citrichinensis]|uniref:Transcription factor Pcc1-domain-containing protein n=1 Tax=Phyllosticta citrichinensis TaxID=1130410 RepID=A0ABR1XH72_9PEZI